MNTLAFILNIVFTMIEAFWIFFMADSFLERKYTLSNSFLNKLIIILPFLLGVLMTLIMNEIELTSLYTGPAMMVYYFVVVLFLWKADFMIALSIVEGYFLFILVSELIDINVISFIGGKELINYNSHHVFSLRFS